MIGMSRFSRKIARKIAGFLSRRAAWVAVLTGSLAATPAAAADAPPDFARDVLPILRRSCFECHGPDKQKGGLRLDSKQAAFQGGDAGDAIVPGKPDDSELLRRVLLPKDDPDVMPARGELLTKAQSDVLRAWISAGAAWPEKIEASSHWAYQKPVRPPLPVLKNQAWPKNDLDRFVLRRLEQEGMQPAPEADRETLIRRATLDLTGLPPTIAEIDAFLNDTRSDAYERVVDRLLSSPQFGARWARPWLDLARYADSHGFQRDDLRELWPYRDWVIEALNADMPFDRFTIEQVAGDLLPEATEAQRIATGFSRCTTTNVEAGTEPEETRVNQIFDRVNTTGAIWLGTTLECAQCHDHKYDPFTQQDYYRLFAFFNSTEIEADRSNPKVPGSIRFLGPSMPLTDEATEAERAQLTAELNDLTKQIEAREQEFATDAAAWEAALAKAVEEAPQTHVLEIADFDSEGGAPHKILEDHSVLLVDDPPEKDTYTITVRTKLTNIRGFKLEALTDPSLPGMGPGRGDPKRPNFVLNTFKVELVDEGDEAKLRPVVLQNGKASFSQKNFSPDGAIDDDPKTAWAINPKFHEAHWATFETDKPVGDAAGATLRFTLVQNFGGGRTIGRVRLSALTGDPRGQSVPADVVAILKRPAEMRNKKQTERLADYRLELDPAAKKLVAQSNKLQQRLRAIKPPTTLVMRELDAPREAHVFMRGNYTEPGAPVEPGAPAALNPLPEGPLNRLTLARWLVSRDNPLTARVTVNRWWAELFGRGIVGTVEDFGIKGEPPTHPELLDWLAVEFMAENWSMKQWLRTVVTSATYRQSSRATAEQRERDPDNRLLSRGPRFRLDAETIRDNALAVAGLLSLKAGGPPVRPYQPDGLWTKIGGERADYVVSPGEDKYRRGVYVVWKRSAPYPSFVNFDAPVRLTCVTKRSRSNTPLQALTLLNDPVYIEAAMSLAKRMVTEIDTADTSRRIEHGFRLALSRRPTVAEFEALSRLYDTQLTAGLKSRQAARQLVADYDVPKKTSAEEFAAWYAVSAALLNLDEAITKE
jgi:mono/diheme cytochrome c family protein